MHTRILTALRFGLTGIMATLAFSLAAVAAGGDWEQRAPLPDDRTEVTATTDGEHIYLIGGFGIGIGGQPGMPRAMHVYTPDSDAWQTLGDIPEGVHHAGFVHHDGKLYIIGGYSDHAFTPIDNLWIFDLDAGEWRSGPSMPTARGSVAAAVLDGRIHVVGGKVDRETSVAIHEVFDPASGKWEARSDMFTARDHHGAAVINGRLYVVAGRAGNDFEMTANEIYDPTTDRWERGAELPTGRSGIGITAHDGYLYVFGGETFTDERRTFEEVERYDPATDQWESLNPMPTARHGMGVAVHDGRIYTIAGGPGAGLTFSNLNEVLVPPK